MKHIGFEWLHLPLVSGHAETQQKLRRRIPLNVFQQAVHWANAASLPVVAYIIIGLPDDSIDAMLDDILFLTSQQVLIGPSIFYPPPGTPVYDQCIRRQLISPCDWVQFRSSAIVVETEQFSRTDIVTLFRLIRAINFAKSLADRYLSGNDNLRNFLAGQIQDPTQTCFPTKLSRNELGMRLLFDLFVHDDLHGVAMEQQSDRTIQYTSFPYRINPALVKQFLNRVERTRITGIQTNHAFTFSCSALE